MTIDEMDISDPKALEKWTAFVNTDDECLYVWTGKRWIKVEDEQNDV
jgi:hypothetical protein